MIVAMLALLAVVFWYGVQFSREHQTERARAASFRASLEARETWTDERIDREVRALLAKHPERSTAAGVLAAKEAWNAIAEVMRVPAGALRPDDDLVEFCDALSCGGASAEQDDLEEYLHDAARHEATPPLRESDALTGERDAESAERRETVASFCLRCVRSDESQVRSRV